ncbi:hypothetical protein [Bacillus sp. FJAT-29814]|uniref:hypothetical protein n=1 Tax=Bacillus sp. FJAT-29814 TaxID=1729688 RepID=UPI000AECB120|nr:hypothetical protein [Bacillus sp. FJAT-29814]
MTNAPFKIRLFTFLIDYLLIVLYGVLVVGTISFLFSSYINPYFQVLLSQPN